MNRNESGTAFTPQAAIPPVDRAAPSSAPSYAHAARIFGAAAASWSPRRSAARAWSPDRITNPQAVHAPPRTRSSSPHSTSAMKLSGPSLQTGQLNACHSSNRPDTSFRSRSSSLNMWLSRSLPDRRKGPHLARPSGVHRSFFRRPGVARERHRPATRFVPSGNLNSHHPATLCFPFRNPNSSSVVAPQGGLCFCPGPRPGTPRAGLWRDTVNIQNEPAPMRLRMSCAEAA